MPQNLGANHPLQTPSTTTTLSSSAGPVNISFSFINDADVLVFLGGTLRTNSSTGNENYTINSAKTQITFNSAVSGAVIITRKSDLLSKVRTFTAGSSVRAADLNQQFDQVMQLIQDNYELLRGIILNDGNDEITVGRDSIIANDKVRTESIQDNAVTLDKIAAGNNNQVLISSGGAPIWSNNVDVQGTLDVTGTTTLDGALNVAGNADLNGTLDVDGNTELDDVNVSGTLDVAGNSTFDGDVDLGNATTDTITINGEVDSNIVPSTDGSRHLGSSTKRWHTVHADNIEATTLKGGNGGASVTEADHATHVVNDTTYFTTAAAEARFWRQDTGGSETITGTGWTAADNRVATTRAIDNRIINLVDGVGGFVPIADETSFPAENPDINSPKGPGTIVSIGALANDLVFNAQGQVTIANGRGQGNPVIITGGPQSFTIAANSGALVETTATDHTYTWHRTTPDGANVNTVANAIVNVNNVGGSIANVNTVAGQISPTNNISTVAGVATEIGRLGTADAVADMNTLGTADIVADMNTLATAANVTAMDNCSDDIANINTVAGSIANVNTVAADLNEVDGQGNDASEINTVAGAIANVNAVGNSIANVNTVAGNLAGVNAFAARYRAPQTTANEYTTDNDTGDLYFNTSSNELRVFNGTSWQAGVTAGTGFASLTGATFTGPILLDNNDDEDVPDLSFDGDADTGIWSDAADHISFSAGGNKVFEIGTNGVEFGSWNGSTIAEGRGGTGETTYSAGQLLIGNNAGGLTKATLTGTSPVTVTNGNGSISIDVPNATTSADGLMASGDKSKLNGIASGAEVNVATNLGQTTGVNSLTITSSTGNNVTIAEASGSIAGVMSKAHHDKLDGIETGADVTDATNVAAAGAVMEGDTTTASMSFVVNEDDMSSDSDTKVPTQQSVKAYVDNQVGGISSDAIVTPQAAQASRTFSNGNNHLLAGTVTIDNNATWTLTGTAKLIIA